MLPCTATGCNALVARWRPTGGRCDNGHAYIFWGSANKLYYVRMPNGDRPVSWVNITCADCERACGGSCRR